MSKDTGSEMKRVMSRIKKMMRIANDAAASEGERDNALRMAHATLAKYNLNMAEVESRGEETDDKRASETSTTKDFPWMRTVVNAVAKMMFCEHFYIRQTGGKVQHYFVGKESNIYTARELSLYVIASIDREASRVAREETGKSGNNYWRSFCKGAAHVIWERCSEIRAEAEKASKPSPKTATGTALVLASVYEREHKANALYIQNVMGIKLKSGRSRERNTSWGASDRGRAFGKGVSLNRQLK